MKCMDAIAIALVLVAAVGFLAGQLTFGEALFITWAAAASVALWNGLD